MASAAPASDSPPMSPAASPGPSASAAALRLRAQTKAASAPSANTTDSDGGSSSLRPEQVHVGSQPQLLAAAARRLGR